MSFENQPVLVTGATSGIGRAIAVAFGQVGAKVGVLGRDATRANQVVTEIQAAGGEAIPLLADVQDACQTETAINQFAQEAGGLVAAVNAAGLDLEQSLVDYSLAEFDAVFGTNVRGLFVCMQAEIRAMRPQKTGAILNLTSIAARHEVPHNALYNASKAAVSMLTRCAALEEGPQGIRVNELAPGPVDTPMLRGFLAKAGADGITAGEALLAQVSPLGRIGTPEELAQAAVFLCSPEAAYITGACLTVDGGFSLGVRLS